MKPNEKLSVYILSHDVHKISAEKMFEELVQTINKI